MRALEVRGDPYLGVRFLTPGHTHVPRLGSPQWAGPVDRTHHPPLVFRGSHYGEVLRNPLWATRLRVNHVTFDPRLGGRSRLRLVGHSFCRQLPSATFGAAHPEYYCLREGRRLARVASDFSDNQPCLSHPDVARLITQADPMAANPSGRTSWRCASGSA